jgi:hypothetical protein
MSTLKEVHEVFPEASLKDIKALLDARQTKREVREKLIKCCTIQENLSHKGDHTDRMLKDVEPYKTMFKEAQEEQKRLEKLLEEAYMPVFQTKLYNKQSGMYCAMLEYLN